MKRISLSLLVTLAFSGVVQALEEEGKPVAQTKCPVMGSQINKDVYHDYKGKRTYFCCAGCIEKFAKAPEKYIKTMEDSGITLAKAPVYQTKCPVMGGKVNKELSFDYKGKRIYFCCAGCETKFAKTPEKYIKKMEDAGITLANATVPQTKCPVMGSQINKDVYHDYKGKRIYFCCAGCEPKFAKAPEKYIKQMESQGVLLDKTPPSSGKTPPKKTKKKG